MKTEQTLDADTLVTSVDEYPFSAVTAPETGLREMIDALNHVDVSRLADDYAEPDNMAIEAISAAGFEAFDVPCYDDREFGDDEDEARENWHIQCDDEWRAVVDFARARLERLMEARKRDNRDEALSSLTALARTCESFEEMGRRITWEPWMIDYISGDDFEEIRYGDEILDAFGDLTITAWKASRVTGNAD